jgi:hypothetical protein
MSINSSNKIRASMDTLKKYKDKPLFEVPEKYFEQFQHDVIQRVMKEEKRHNTLKKWRSAVSIAASVAIIFILSFYIFLNRNINEPFYVHQEIPPEESVLTIDSIHLAEVTELAIEIPNQSTPKPLSPKPPVVAETIVYRAVDYYLDDYEIDSFFDTMYDLECYYDY